MTADTLIANASHANAAAGNLGLERMGKKKRGLETGKKRGCERKPKRELEGGGGVASRNEVQLLEKFSGKLPRAISIVGHKSIDVRRTLDPMHGEFIPHETRSN